MGLPGGTENAQWSIECDCPSVPSSILFPFTNHQRFLKILFIFQLLPNLRKQSFQYSLPVL